MPLRLALVVGTLAVASGSGLAPCARANRPALRLRGGESLHAATLVAAKPPSSQGKLAVRGGSSGIDWQLMVYFVGWYVGNYFYTLNNKLALKASGGAKDGFPVTIGFLQMVIGSLYALFAWGAPDMRALPNVTPSDLMQILPVAACSAGAHLSSIMSMNLGAVSFAQIVKASEPAFAALIGVTLYGKSISQAKWLCLIPVIGGVCLASIKELDFSTWALIAACVANIFAAFRANENKKLMDTPGLSNRIGSTGNQFALSTLLGTLTLFPFFLIFEAKRFGTFVELFKSSKILSSNVLTSGLYFYLCACPRHPR